MKRFYAVPGRGAHAGERCSHRHECVLGEKYNKASQVKHLNGKAVLLVT
jgi:hypothetical protein